MTTTKELLQRTLEVFRTKQRCRGTLARAYAGKAVWRTDKPGIIGENVKACCPVGALYIAQDELDANDNFQIYNEARMLLKAAALRVSLNGQRYGDITWLNDYNAPKRMLYRVIQAAIDAA